MNNKPIEFYIDPKNKPKTLQKQIESHGGKLLPTREIGCIELVPNDLSNPPENLTEQVYSHNYIKECISAKTLLDLKSFSFKKKMLPVMNRRGYKPEEEEAMRNYVESHSGSPASVKFWEDALAKGLGLDHSADSLRYHWKRVMLKKENEDILQIKRLCQTADPAIKKIKTEKLFVPNEDEMRNVRVVVKNSSRSVLDFAEINLKCEEEEIDQKFENLIQICCMVGNKRVTEQEVLRALLARNGKIDPTVEHFASLT